jgi:hypothetical protein
MKTNPVFGESNMKTLRFFLKLVVLCALAVLPASAQITLTQHTFTTKNTSGTSVAATFGSTTGAGHLYIVSITCPSGCTLAATPITDTEGNTFCDVRTPANCGSSAGNLITMQGTIGQNFFAKNVVGGTTDAITCTFGGSQVNGMEIWITEITGASTTSPIDQHAEASAATGGNASQDAITTSAMTLSQANEFIYGLMLVASSVSNHGTPYTTLNLSTNGNENEYDITSTCVVRAVSGQQASSGVWWVAGFSVKAATAGASCISKPAYQMSIY